MKLLVALPIVVLLGVAVAGCNPSGSSAETDAPQSTITEYVTPPPGTAPAAPQPAKDETCPYLDNQFVADANGQHVTKVKVSSGATPACFYYRPDGGLQLTIWIYKGDARTAKAIVDEAAPIKTSDPASQPTGWQGGSQPTDSGAVYAVAKGGDSVVVTTNQKQSIKARRVAVQAIQTLGL